MIDNDLESVVTYGTVRGIGLWEILLSMSEESNTDHAAKWETSNMMFFCPEFVNTAELGGKPISAIGLLSRKSILA